MLESKAPLKFVMSGTQILALDKLVQEKFSDFHRSYARLSQLLRKVDGVILLSGDVHSASYLRSDCGFSYEITELTASGLTHTIVDHLKGSEKVANYLARTFMRSKYNLKDRHYVGRHFGSVVIDWEKRTVSLQIRSKTGEIAVPPVVIEFDKELKKGIHA